MPHLRTRKLCAHLNRLGKHDFLTDEHAMPQASQLQQSQKCCSGKNTVTGVLCLVLAILLMIKIGKLKKVKCPTHRDDGSDGDNVNGDVVHWYKASYWKHNG